MAGVRVGVDFGTSNSAAALPGPRPGAPARVVELDPAGEDRRLYRSVLYFPDESREVFSGAEAIERYLDEVDGRFIQSAKSFLPSTSFHATEIRRRSYRLEDLVAIVLRHMREQIEAAAGGPIDKAVFGRPAVFSPDAEKDRVAQERLAKAAEIAGFPAPTFLIEPIAAALGYEAALDRDEVVLVGDFGAGTSDFTLMRLGPSFREKADRRGDVIASTGVYVGGDNFDAAIVEKKLLPRFGEGSTYLALTKRMPLPTWMTRKLLSWHEMALLRERSTMDFLRKARVTSDDPVALANLVTLIEDNLAYHLYRAVEAAKRGLGESDEALIAFHEGAIEIEESIDRPAFEAWTAPLRDQLTAAVDRLLESAGGVEPEAIFLTGGTSKIPSVRRLFTERFGEGRIRSGDAFTSVVAGLGRAAAS
jgi:hypothetical chaperone protein